MIRIHETHTDFYVDGARYNERDKVPVLGAVTALTVCLDRNFVVEEAKLKKLVLKVEGERGKVTVTLFTGSVRDMKALLVATFIHAVFRDNMRGQELLRNLIGDRDAFQDNLVDMHEAGATWKTLALGIPMGLTDVKQMTALYEKQLVNKFGSLRAVDITA